MDTSARVLVFDVAPNLSRDVDDRLRQRGFAPVRMELEQGGTGATPFGANLAVVLVDAADAVDQAEQLATLLQRLVEQRVATLVWGRPDRPRTETGPLVEWLGADVGLDELVGKLGTLAHYAPMIKGFERELNHLQRLGHQLNHYFNEIDQEMRLAGRLQRDFLPRQLPNLPPYVFHAVYRPASWVSGDMYDVFRIDEHHVGLFVADAMGHGVAAGLLTMFLRYALMTRRTNGDVAQIPSPAEALRGLDACLTQQKLPNCQFVTAAYAILDLQSGALQIARAGHPYPLHVATDGTVHPVRIDGSLLGIDGVPVKFDEATVRLAPGEKLILYTDGVEDVLAAPHPDDAGELTFTPEFQEWARRPAAELINAVQDSLDRREGSLHPADDITLVVLEMDR